MPLLAGIDVGLHFIERTSGVAKSGGRRFIVNHTTSDALSREAALDYRPSIDPPIDVLAIDGPILPAGTLHYDERACEKVFVWGPFQKRCKPGESHVQGTGRALRRAGCDTARQFATSISGADTRVPFPRVQKQRNVVEAFPNAFLGVLLPEEVFDARIERGEKTNRLYDECCRRGVFKLLSDKLGGCEPELWDVLTTGAVKHRDERASMVCLLTALSVWSGRYVAVGEPAGGYIFLPPWSLWADWAKRALAANRQDQRLRTPVDIWIEGACYSSGQPLP